MSNDSPSIDQDRDVYVQRWGHPSTWTGDWSRKGRYLKDGEQSATQKRLLEFTGLLMGLSVRKVASQAIAAVMGVSRETVDRRLRPAGLKNPPGHVGAPKKGAIDFACERNNLLGVLATNKVLFGSLCKAYREEEGKTVAEVVAKVPNLPASQLTRWQRGEWDVIKAEKLVQVVRAITDDVRKQTNLIIAFLVDLTPVEYRPQIEVGQRGEVQRGESTSKVLKAPWAADIQKTLDTIGHAYTKDKEFQMMVDTMAKWAVRINKGEGKDKG